MKVLGGKATLKFFRRQTSAAPVLLEAPARKVFPVAPQELGGFPEEVAGQVEEDQRQSQEVEGHGDGARVVEEGHVNPCQKEIDQD